jgi:hypothetical protein
MNDRSRRYDLLRDPSEGILKQQADFHAAQSRDYDALQESHKRAAAQLEKQRVDAEQNALTLQQPRQSTTGLHLENEAVRHVAAEVAARQEPIRPGVRPGLTIKSSDIGDVVVQPVMKRQTSAYDRDETNIRAMNEARTAANKSFADLNSHVYQARTEAPAKAVHRPNKEHQHRKVEGRIIGRGIKRALGGIMSLAGKGLDGLANLFEGLFGGGPQRDAPSQHELAAEDKLEVQLELQAERDATGRQSDDDRTKRRQEAMRQFGREIEEGLRRDLEQGGGRKIDE